MDAPLRGYRVIEISHALAGPFAGMTLGDLGADVIKVEPPGGRTGDVGAGSTLRGESIYFMSLHRNKRSVVLDLKSAGGRRAFAALVSTADVLLHNMRPGVDRRLGFDPETLRRSRPDIITCAISGYGQTGPLAARPGYDYHMQALSGAMAITGEPGGKPTKTGLSVIDHMAGYVAAEAVIAALLWRERGGGGRDIDISLLDVQMAMFTYLAADYLQTGALPEKVADSGHTRAVPFQMFATADGHVMVAGYTDRFFAALCRALGLPELVDDPRYATMAARQAHREPLIAALAARFAGEPSGHWCRVLAEAGVPAEPVQTLDQALRHPQVVARGMVQDLPHPRGGSVRLVGHPFRISGLAPQRRAPPSYGQHTAELLAEVGLAPPPPAGGAPSPAEAPPSPPDPAPRSP